VLKSALAAMIVSYRKISTMKLVLELLKISIKWMRPLDNMEVFIWLYKISRKKQPWDKSGQEMLGFSPLHHQGLEEAINKTTSSHKSLLRKCVNTKKEMETPQEM
jgi:hypothetical protein